MTDMTFDPFAGGELVRVSPTTWPQREIIASAQISDEANTAFNEAISLTIEGELDIGLLETCLTAFVDRHDILRATFSRKGDELCLHQPKPFPLEYEDLRGLDADAQDKEIRALWQNIAISPMNLEEGPLFFSWIKRLGDRQWELVIAAHHVICDGWSFGLLLKELSQLYNNQGRADGLPSPESFFEYAEHSDVQEVANIDIDYWREKFRQMPPVLDLPLDKIRPDARTFQARRIEYTLNEELVALLPKAAAKMKASLVNMTMASYFALLYRLTSTSDLVVGLPVAGQAAFNRLNQVGHMVQLLPIRLTVDGTASFLDLVGRVKAEVLNASEHPRFTFGKLLEKMVVDRTRVPLMCTIFNIDQPINTLEFGQATGTVRTVPRAAENFEIFLNILPGTKSLTIEATYSTALFSEETIVAWLQSLENILAEVSQDPDKKIADLILSKEIPEVLQRANEQTRELVHPDFLTAFKQQVEKTPEAEAVIYGETRWSYRQLDQLSDRLAMVLAEKDIKDGSVVAICCRRSEKMVAAILAAFKVGAAYLPLDPDFPKERLLYIVQDSGAGAVIEDNAAPKGIWDVSLPRFDLETVNNLPEVQGEFTLPQSKGDRLAYIIYTSGSTGKPKGVRAHHHGLINFLEHVLREPDLTAKDRVLAVVTLSFDMSVHELLAPLICGATLVVADHNHLKDGEKLAGLIEKHHITFISATPSFWRLLLASSWKNNPESPIILKAVSGGEPLPLDFVGELIPRVAELWNGYGPTETTIFTTIKRIRRSDAIITIGKPMTNTQVYVLDQNGNPLPITAPGELYIGGQGVTSGYHNRPELTAEKFIEHPKFGRIYRTGDLAKVMPNGDIQHLGRLDDQVKLRGYRIELGEIEAALAASPGVSGAAVYLWQLSLEDVRIVACFVPENKDNFQESTLRKHLRKILPGYMVPQYLLPIEHIPLMPNGKINRRALPKPEQSESVLISRSELVSDHEKLIAQIWADLIKPKHPFSQEDVFFEAGGHSLLALEAIRRIENATGKRFAMSELITDHLATLAEKVAAVSRQEKKQESGPVALSSTRPRRLSPEQQRLIERQLEFPENVSSNIPAAWILEGDLNLAIFKKSVKRVFERQTALRTVIQVRDKTYLQFVKHVDDIICLEFLDCSESQDPLTEALELAKQMVLRAFIPLNNLLFRCHLFKIQPHKHLLVILPHQLVFDGWSFDIFLNELEANYRAFSAGNTPDTVPLPFEFRDYAEWCQERPVNQSHFDYHKRIISNAVVATFVKNSQEKGLCQRRVYKFSADKLLKIESFCSIHKLRLHEFLFSIFTIILTGFIKDSRTVIGMPVTGRYSSDVIGLIGSFFSFLPCEVRIEGNSFIEIAKNLSAQLREFHDHQEISYSEIVRGTSLDKDFFPLLMSSTFIFQDVRNRPTLLADLKLVQVDMPRKQTELPVEFWTRIQPDGFIVAVDYDDFLIGGELVEFFSAKINDMLSDIEQIDCKIGNNSSVVVKKRPLWRRLFQ